MSRSNIKNIHLSPINTKKIPEEQNIINKNKSKNNLIKGNKEKDERLSFTLSILGLENLINFFNEKNLSFIDLLLLSKDSLKELELEMYQRNRIYNFANSFTKYSKYYSMDEILQFFENHKQFLFDKKTYENKIMKNKANSNDNKNIKQEKIILINDENKNENNFFTPRNKNNKMNNKKIYHSTNKKIHRGKNVLKKYLSIKKDVDDFLNKLNRQKEDTQILSYKYGNFIKRPNYIERNEDDIMISEEKKFNKKNRINKLVEKMIFLENKKIDQKTFEHLNQIKKYIIEKGDNITIEELIKLENEIEKVIELNIKKEKLKNNLQIYEKKINDEQNMINQINNEGYNNYNNYDDY
jgi:hypothetical protein